MAFNSDSFSFGPCVVQNPAEGQFSGFSSEHSTLSFPVLVHPMEAATEVSLRQETSESRWMDASSFSSSASSSRSTGSECTPPVFPEACGCLDDHVSVSDRVLGTGQFGKVRECTDLTTGMSLAVKSMRKCQVDFQEVKKEVEVMRCLQGHSGVVQLGRVVEDSDSVHLVMDMCRGGDLFDEVVRRERFSEVDAAPLFAEIVEAVAFCHSRGVVHRDLKPENILLTRQLLDGVAIADLAPMGPITKLADFGLAATQTGKGALSGVAGSPFYIAPEVLVGEYNAKADVWSLGVILYVLLSGTHPFWGETDGMVFESICRDEPDLSSAPWGEVSIEAKRLVQSMLCKDPQRRPSAESVRRHPWFVTVCQ